jgi:hypothetical protein
VLEDVAIVCELVLAAQLMMKPGDLSGVVSTMESVEGRSSIRG